MCALLSNRFYGQDIRASAILNGDVEPPPEAYDLYTILQDYTEKYTTDWQNKHMQASSKVTFCALLKLKLKLKLAKRQATHNFEYNAATLLKKYIVS